MKLSTRPGILYLVILLIALILSSTAVHATIFGDFDKDSDTDFYAKNVYMNINGTFFNLTNGTGLPTLANVYQGGVADIDNDNDVDIYVVINGSQNRLYLNDGSGNFNLDTAYTNIKGSAGDSLGFYFGLIDNDTRVDLFACDSLFLWNSSCSCFSNVTSVATLSSFNNMKQVIAVDILFRGKRDLIGVDNSGTVRYFYNQGDTNSDSVDEYADVALVTGTVLSNSANSIAVADFDPDNPANPLMMDVYVAESGKNKLWLANPPLVPGIADYPSETAGFACVDDAASTVWAATGILDNVTAFVPAPANLAQAQNTTDIYCANLQNNTEYTRNGSIGTGTVTFANRTQNITQLNITPEYAEARDLNGDGYDDVIVVGSVAGAGGSVASFVVGVPPDTIFPEARSETFAFTFDSTGFVGAPGPGPGPGPGTTGAPGITSGGPAVGHIPRRIVDECTFTAQLPAPRWPDNEDLPFEFLDKGFEFSTAKAEVDNGFITFQMAGPFDSAYSTQTVIFGQRAWTKNPRAILDVSDAPSDCEPVTEMPVPVPDCSAAYLEQVPPVGTVAGYIAGEDANADIPGTLDDGDQDIDLITASAIGLLNSRNDDDVYISLFPWNQLAFILASEPGYKAEGKDLLSPIKLSAVLKEEPEEIKLEATLVRTTEGINLVAVLEDEEKKDRYVGRLSLDIPAKDVIDLPPSFSPAPENPNPIIEIRKKDEMITLTPVDDSGLAVGDTVEIPGETVIAEGPDSLTVEGTDGLILGDIFVPGAELGESPSPLATPVYFTPVAGEIGSTQVTGGVQVIPVAPERLDPGDCFGPASTTQGVGTGDSPKGTTSIDLSDGPVTLNFPLGTTGIVAQREGAGPYVENKIFVGMQGIDAGEAAGTGSAEDAMAGADTAQDTTGATVTMTDTGTTAVEPEDGQFDATGMAVSSSGSYRNLLFVLALALSAVLITSTIMIFRSHRKLSSRLESIGHKTRSKGDQTRFC